MRILSFDTSASDLHVALSDNDNIDAEVVITAKPGKRQYASAELIPTIHKLLEDCLWTKENIDVIAVGTGPGSFTGIRVAVVTARTLAQALEIPLVGVSLFDCYATQTELPATYLLDAGRGHVYVGACAVTSEPCHGPFSTTLGELNGQLAETCHLYSEISLLNELKSKDIEAKLLPPLNNIAAMQSKIAFHRVSLKESQLRQNSKASDLRKALRKEFHYEVVRPLYLRQASITPKGAVT